MAGLLGFSRFSLLFISVKWPFHILFWFFAALYVFDYLIDVFPWTQAVQYTAFEVGVLIAEFYLNLKLLVPRLVPRKRYASGDGLWGSHGR